MVKLILIEKNDWGSVHYFFLTAQLKVPPTKIKVSVSTPKKSNILQTTSLYALKKKKPKNYTMLLFL